MSSHDRYTLSLITPDDYPTLANINILAFMRDPLHYMTYPPNTSHEEIVEYNLENIRFAEEGSAVQTIKIVDNQTPDKQIAGFASWVMGPRATKPESPRPHGANFKFVEDFRRKKNPVWKRVFDDRDIELRFMAVLPSYQKQGIGRKLLQWGMQKAACERRRVVTLVSTEGRELYLTNGFEVKSEVRMNMGEYGATGVYIQSLMVWNGD